MIGTMDRGMVSHIGYNVMGWRGGQFLTVTPQFCSGIVFVPVPVLELYVQYGTAQYSTVQYRRFTIAL
jgi:hypothetical protein